MFFKYNNIPNGALSSERAEYVQNVLKGLPRAQIVETTRHLITLKLTNMEDLLQGDVTQSGLTVYLGGFDWVTFPTPQHVLQKFPEFLPLPQQVFKSPVVEESELDPADR